MTAPERGTATLAPDLAGGVGLLARALMVAGRSRTLYRPEPRRRFRRRALDDLLALLAEDPETSKRARSPW